jgi:hypothetical protein
VKNVELWDGDDDEPRHVIINTEWGAFGANGELDFIRTKWDIAGSIRGAAGGGVSRWPEGGSQQSGWGHYGPNALLDSLQ